MGKWDINILILSCLTDGNKTEWHHERGNISGYGSYTTDRISQDVQVNSTTDTTNSSVPSGKCSMYTMHSESE